MFSAEITQDGEDWTMSWKTSVTSNTVKFKLGVEFEEKNPGGIMEGIREGIGGEIGEANGEGIGGGFTDGICEGICEGIGEGIGR